MELHCLNTRLKTLAVFRGVLKDPVMEALCACLTQAEALEASSAYAEMVSRLYQTDGGDLGRHILRIVLEDENAFIRAIGRGETPPEYMTRSVETELETFQAAAEMTPERLKAGLDGGSSLPDFGVSAVELAAEYRRRTAEIGRYGYGVYAAHHMFCLDGNGQPEPVLRPDPVRLADLVDYERERRLVLDNVRALLSGRQYASYR